ncbi:MAG: methyltransferase domain-containing protein, partial [Acidobacteriota bacterium]
AFTELYPAFLRRGTRTVKACLPAGCELQTCRYDINLEPEAQGFQAETFDAALSVNTLHLAADLVASLGALRRLLRPAGALVISELVRPGPSSGVHLELPFTLLEAFRRTPLDGLRQRPGFLTLDGWLVALERAGFSSHALIPAAFRRCAQLYPGFYCCAIIARR